ncbi:U7 snRNA-associated Sm-like protein LSm11 [Leguminivora glycinivorella]|uniref:U7 snRNA-associated Sm-like protein LSm11 n=1 Tax=Leguminivora glycinivorella TaxID=1035111 RepID=UPI00200D20C7|nr:U7 snRNA-associated Sm-like protein LSm11 [Leguminivora glycinivorella]
MSDNSDTGGNDPEPTPGTSGLQDFSKLEVKSDDEGDGSTSDSEINAYSLRFNPMKALYSDRMMLPVPDAPVYENLQQFEAALLKNQEILAVGMGQQVQEREKKKLERKQAYEQALEEKNRQRFAKYEVTVRPERKQGKNVLTREQTITGPLSALRNAMQKNHRVKVITRGPTGLRGVLHGDLTAFDKHWNLVLTNVLEIYCRKPIRKLKYPPAGGRPVPQGTANMISPLPEVVVSSLGNRIFECSRHIPQLLVRGEHIVLINVVDQYRTK